MMCDGKRRKCKKRGQQCVLESLITYYNTPCPIRSDQLFLATPLDRAFLKTL